MNKGFERGVSHIFGIMPLIIGLTLWDWIQAVSIADWFLVSLNEIFFSDWCPIIPVLSSYHCKPRHFWSKDPIWTFNVRKWRRSENSKAIKQILKVHLACYRLCNLINFGWILWRKLIHFAPLIKEKMLQSK